MLENLTTWIVTADGRQAHVHEERVRHGPLHPLPDEELTVADADRPSSHAHRATVHARHGAGRHGTGEDRPEEAMERRFLERVASGLEAAALAGRFERLVIMAPPRALGILRGALDTATSRLIEVSEPHDRMNLSADLLREKLRAARIPD